MIFSFNFIGIDNVGPTALCKAVGNIMHANIVATVGYCLRLTEVKLLLIFAQLNLKPLTREN